MLLDALRIDRADKDTLIAGSPPPGQRYCPGGPTGFILSMLFEFFAAADTFFLSPLARGAGSWTFLHSSILSGAVNKNGGYCKQKFARIGKRIAPVRRAHVGIVGRRDETGDLLILHCASNANNVIITDADGFASVGRPQYYRN